MTSLQEARPLDGSLARVPTVEPGSPAGAPLRLAARLAGGSDSRAWPGSRPAGAPHRTGARCQLCADCQIGEWCETDALSSSSRAVNIAERFTVPQCCTPEQWQLGDVTAPSMMFVWHGPALTMSFGASQEQMAMLAVPC